MITIESLKQALSVETDDQLAKALVYQGKQIYKDAAQLRYSFKNTDLSLATVIKISACLPSPITIGKGQRVTLKKLGKMLQKASKTEISNATGIISQNLYKTQATLLDIEKNIGAYKKGGDIGRIVALSEYFGVEVVL